MPIRIRKLIGAIVSVVFVIFYALIAMALAQARFVQEASAPVQLICYAVLGLAWVLPLMPLIAWMAREDKP